MPINHSVEVGILTDLKRPAKTLLAGLYGMHLESVPELEFRYRYFILLDIIGLIMVSLLY